VFDSVLAGIVAGARRSNAPRGVTTRIVAVDGGGGAGKSTIAALLASELGCEVVHTDDFASWDEPLEWWPRLLAEVLEPLSRNEAASFEAARWEPDAPPRRIDISPAPFLVLEGVSACREAFRPFLAYTVWVETPADERLRRGLERDGEHARAQWEDWMREEEDYRLRERPDVYANAVVTGASRSTG
jgi:uridine kinase